LLRGFGVLALTPAVLATITINLLYAEPEVRDVNVSSHGDPYAALQ
jgi:hypothetical protein